MFDLSEGEWWGGVLATLWTIFLFTITAIVAHYYLVERRAPRAALNPLEAARARYARGDISREDFQRIQQDLAGHFMGYPVDFVFAVVDDPREADTATQDLKEAGFEPRDLRVFRGEAGALRIDSTGSSHGVLPELWRYLQALGTDGEDLREYESEVEAGSSVIGVHSHGRDRRDRALDVLRAHNAHHINYYGRLYFENIEP